MPKKFIILLIMLPILITSCGAFQLKWDHKVQEHMETLLTNPDQTILDIIDNWNKRPDLGPGQSVDLEFIQENVTRLEFDNKKAHCRIFLKDGLDFGTQRKVTGHVMVIFGLLYWQYPEQKREVVYLFGNIDDIENFVFSWKKGDDKPVIDKDRTMSFV